MAATNLATPDAVPRYSQQMGWSSRLFLLSSDDALHRLASSTCSRMLRHDARCRLPDFAGQRVRMVGVTVELADRVALGVRHRSFSILEFDVDGRLDVQRLNAQQVSRLDAMLDGKFAQQSSDTTVIDATSYFLARGGSWEPDRQLLRRIEAAALGAFACPRVRVVEEFHSP
jgi:hypothetical protein